MKTPNLNALRVFATVARHGSMQRAADDLHVTHGAVSQRIRQIEGDLGLALFTRGARGVLLTPEGERLRKAVDEALAILTAALVDLDERQDRILLHVGASFATKWLMPRMEEFAARFPDISLATEVHERPLIRNLGSNEIAIWPGEAPHPNPECLTLRLTGVHLVSVCSPDFPRPGGPVDLETLLTMPLLQDAHRRWERLMGDTDHPARHRLLNFDRSALALEAAAGGHGIAIAPTYMVEKDVQAGRLVEIWSGPGATQAHLFLSSPRTNAGETKLRKTVDWIVSEFGQPTGDHSR